MKPIIRNQRAKNFWPEYLFFFDQGTDATEIGYMPLSGQFGYIIGYHAASEAAYNRTIAHEIAHVREAKQVQARGAAAAFSRTIPTSVGSMFNLRHTFSNENSHYQLKGSTANLLDYAAPTATGLYKYQWDLIHDPESIWFAWMEEEEEGEAEKPFKILAMKMTREDINLPTAYLDPEDQSTFSMDPQYYLDDLTKENDGVYIPLKKSYMIIIQGAGGKFIKFNKSNNNIKYGPTSTYNFEDNKIYHATANMSITINALIEGEVILEVHRYDNIEGTLNEVHDKIKIHIFNVTGPFNVPELSKYTYESNYYIEGKSGWKVDNTQGDRMTLKDSETEVMDWVHNKFVDVKWSSAPEGGRIGKLKYKCNENYIWIFNTNIINIKITNGSFTETQCAASKGYRRVVNEFGQTIYEEDDSRINVSASVGINPGISWNAYVTLQSLNNTGYEDIEIGFIQNLEVIRTRAVYKRGDLSYTLVPKLNGISFEGQKWVDYSTSATHINNDIFYFHQGQRNSSVFVPYSTVNQGDISSDDVPNYNFPVEFKIDNKKYDLTQIDILYNFELYIVGRIKSIENGANERYFIYSSATWQWFINEKYPFTNAPINNQYIFNKPNGGTSYTPFVDNNQIQLYFKPNDDGQCANFWLPQFILTP